MAIAGTDIRKSDGAGKSSRPGVRVGVLGLQGDFAKHVEMLEQVPDVSVSVVRTPEEIEQCDGLVLPGGESTTVGKLMARYGVDEAIRAGVSRGMAVFGTCTGMILLAKEIEGSDQHRLGLMDITVRRNASGRQVDSFETDLLIKDICSQSPVRAVFIRAPYVTNVGQDVEILAALETGEVVMVRQGNCIAAAFHPELTHDIRVHGWFVELTRAAVASYSG